MILFSIITVIILIIVIAVLVYPLWSHTSPPIPMGLAASADQERIDLEIEKQTLLNSLAELDLDLAQGRLTSADYQRLKAVDENRLGRILDAMDALSPAAAAPPTPARSGLQSHGVMKWAGSAALSLLVLGTAAGIYEYINGKIGLEAQKRYAETGGAGGPQGMSPNPAEMVARLETRLKNNPNDLQGQIMAGRSYMTLQRIDDARKAWSKVVELDPGNYEGHFFLGLILLQASSPDDQKSSQEALDHFDTALVSVPRDPAILWYKGVSLLRLKQYALVDKNWTDAFQNLAPGTEDAEFVKKALQSLRAGKPPAF
jgi:cytochrome c-type biogenesis protein CcmH